MKRILTAACAAVLLTTVGAGSAEAAKPNRLLATPSAVCSTLVTYGVEPSFGRCVGGLRGEINAFRFPSDEDPTVLIGLFERCAAFEAMGVVSYPFTFEEGPEWPLPVFTAQNRQQCATTLYAYHELAEALFGPEA